MRLIPLPVGLNFPKGALFNRSCPKCQGRMRIIGFIEEKEGVVKILKQLGL
jgi:hypothetical protein